MDGSFTNKGNLNGSGSSMVTLKNPIVHTEIVLFQGDDVFQDNCKASFFKNENGMVSNCSPILKNPIDNGSTLLLTNLKPIFGPEVPSSYVPTCQTNFSESSKKSSFNVQEILSDLAEIEVTKVDKSNSKTEHQNKKAWQPAEVSIIPMDNANGADDLPFETKKSGKKRGQNSNESSSVKETEKQSNLIEETIPAMLSINRVGGSNSPATVTITLKGSTPESDKLLFTSVNGHNITEHVATATINTDNKAMNAKTNQTKITDSNDNMKSTKKEKETCETATKKLKVTTAVDKNSVDKKDSAKKKTKKSNETYKMSQPKILKNNKEAVKASHFNPLYSLYSARNDINSPLLRSLTQKNQNSNVPVSRFGVIVIDTAKLIPPSTTASNNKKNKTENKKKRDKRLGNPEMNRSSTDKGNLNGSESPMVVTLKNPIFHTVQTALHKKVAGSSDLPVFQNNQQASIFKNENGKVFDNRSTLLTNLKPMFGPEVPSSYVQMCHTNFSKTDQTKITDSNDNMKSTKKEKETCETATKKLKVTTAVDKNSVDKKESAKKKTKKSNETYKLSEPKILKNNEETVNKASSLYSARNDINSPLLRSLTQKNQNSNVPVSRFGVIVIDTAKLIPPSTTASNNKKNKTENKKKRDKRLGNPEMNRSSTDKGNLNGSESPMVVTLKNPIFHTVQTALHKKVAGSSDLPVFQNNQQASIFKNENGKVFDNRSTLLTNLKPMFGPEVPSSYVPMCHTNFSKTDQTKITDSNDNMKSTKKEKETCETATKKLKVTTAVDKNSVDKKDSAKKKTKKSNETYKMSQPKILKNNKEAVKASHFNPLYSLYSARDDINLPLSRSLTQKNQNSNVPVSRFGVIVIDTAKLIPPSTTASNNKKNKTENKKKRDKRLGNPEMNRSSTDKGNLNGSESPMVVTLKNPIFHTVQTALHKKVAGSSDLPVFQNNQQASIFKNENGKVFDNRSTLLTNLKPMFGPEVPSSYVPMCHTNFSKTDQTKITDSNDNMKSTKKEKETCETATKKLKVTTAVDKNSVDKKDSAKKKTKKSNETYKMSQPKILKNNKEAVKASHFNPLYSLYSARDDINLPLSRSLTQKNQNSNVPVSRFGVIVIDTAKLIPPSTTASNNKKNKTENKKKRDKRLGNPEMNRSSTDKGNLNGSESPMVVTLKNPIFHTVQTALHKKVAGSSDLPVFQNNQQASIFKNENGKVFDNRSTLLTNLKPMFGPEVPSSYVPMCHTNFSKTDQTKITDSNDNMKSTKKEKETCETATKKLKVTTAVDKNSVDKKDSAKKKTKKSNETYKMSQPKILKNNKEAVKASHFNPLYSLYSARDDINLPLSRSLTQKNQNSNVPVSRFGVIVIDTAKLIPPSTTASNNKKNKTENKKKRDKRLGNPEMNRSSTDKGNLNGSESPMVVTLKNPIFHTVQTALHKKVAGSSDLPVFQNNQQASIFKNENGKVFDNRSTLLTNLKPMFGPEVPSSYVPMCHTNFSKTDQTKITDSNDNMKSTKKEKETCETATKKLKVTTAVDKNSVDKKDSAKKKTKKSNETYKMSQPKILKNNKEAVKASHFNPLYSLYSARDDINLPLSRSLTQKNQNSNVPVSRFGVIVIDTAKLIPPSTTASNDKKNKTENKKKRDKRLGNPEMNRSSTDKGNLNGSGSPMVVTLKNPIFHTVQTALHKKVAGSSDLPVFQNNQQASIFKNENGKVFDNRSTLLTNLKPMFGPEVPSSYVPMCHTNFSESSKKSSFNVQAILSGLPDIQITKVDKTNSKKEQENKKASQPAAVSIIPISNGANGADNFDKDYWPFEGVFTPRDLLDEYMDTEERELDAFKRFCQQSVPPERKEKVKDTVLNKKKDVTYS